MKDSNLMAIYGHENLRFNIGVGKDQLAYYIHYFFNGSGILKDREFIQFLFDEVLTDEQKDVYSSTIIFGPFHVFAELEDFCLQVASFFKRDSLLLLSLGEFNEIAMTVDTTEDLFNKLAIESRSLVKTDDDTKKNFFSNLFN